MFLKTFNKIWTTKYIQQILASIVPKNTRNKNRNGLSSPLSLLSHSSALSPYSCFPFISRNSLSTLIPFDILFPSTQSTLLLLHSFLCFKVLRFKFHWRLYNFQTSCQILPPQNLWQRAYDYKPTIFHCTEWVSYVSNWPTFLKRYWMRWRGILMNKNIMANYCQEQVFNSF